jgi:exopolyphosphatase/guanosine-5'-triphosphate,3'-diphosphate pyrophosphatase
MARSTSPARVVKLSGDSDDGRLAVVDVGSNSLRLVVFDGQVRAPAPIFNEKVLCGLGRELNSTGKLSPAGVALALPNLLRFTRLAKTMEIGRLVLLATAAVREASDGPDFVAEAEALCGWPIQVLSGTEEARLSALGVVAGIPGADGIMGDLGGGSLELVELNAGQVGRTATLPLGPLRLIETCGEDRAAAAAEIDRHLAAIDWLGEARGRGFYPVGGAWRNLARLKMAQDAYPLHVIHGYRLSGEAARSHAGLVGRQTDRSLQRIKSLPRRRLETLPYGALVLDRLLRVTGCEAVIFSALGLREGFLFDRLPAEELARDPLLEMAGGLAAREGRFDDLGEPLFDWTAPLFTEETEAQRRLRRVVCHISDLAWREHADYRAVQAFRRVLHHPFLAIDHPERVFLAFAVYTRYGGNLANPEVADYLRLIDPADAHRARLLGLALRLAYQLSGATAGILRRCTLKLDRGSPDLVLPGDGSVPDGGAVQRHLAALVEAHAGDPGWFPIEV